MHIPQKQNVLFWKMNQQNDAGGVDVGIFIPVGLLRHAEDFERHAPAENTFACSGGDDMDLMLLHLFQKAAVNFKIFLFGKPFQSGKTVAEIADLDIEIRARSIIFVRAPR